MDQAVRRWAQAAGQAREGVLRIGYFGSYARGNWAVGSDLDLVIIVERSDQPFNRRALDWDVATLPVPAEVVVYTQEEWEAMAQEARRFYRTLAHEVVWVYTQEPDRA